MNKLILIGALIFGGQALIFSQVTQNLEDQISKKDGVPDNNVYDESIVDPTYGIIVYESLNPMVDGDSTRMGDDGYACEGWVTDSYATGQIIHKGYYVEGQLKVYKNYYPNGALEREFKALNTFSGQLKVYYPDGQIKSQVKYTNGSPLIWSDFYDNGQLEYYEEYHKSFNYHIAKRSYFKDGKPESLLEMTNKKKLYFSQNDFYSNGNKKLEGELIYDKKAYDYRKIGTWKFYKEDGALDREEKF